MKKIIVIINWLRKGGAENNTVKIVNHLAINNDVTLVVLSDKYDDLRGSIVSDVDVIFGISIIKLFFLYLKEMSKADIIFSSDHRIATYLMLFRLLIPMKKPSLWCRSINNLTMLLGRKSILIKSLVKMTMSRQDVVIAQCAAMQKDLVVNWGVQEERCIVVYNPISNMASFDYSRSIVSNEDNNFIFLFIGRFSKQKRIPLMIESFAKANLPNNARLYLVGYRDWMDSDRSELEAINRVAEHNHVTDRITVFPWTQDSSNFLKLASCFLLTSEFEGFPNVLVEAISNGVPIVSVKCDFGPEEIINDINGFLVNSSSADDISLFIKDAYEKHWSPHKIHLTSLKFSEENQFSKIDKVIS